MSDTTSALKELLADCDARGIRLLPAGDGALTVDARQNAVTPELLDRLKVHKVELLAILRPTLLPATVATATTEGTSMEPVCRCGSTRWRDVPIHDDQSVRRDCGRCGRFIDFVVWGPNDDLADADLTDAQCYYGD